MKKINKLTLIGFALSFLGFVVGQADSMVKDKQMEKIIDEKIEEKLNKEEQEEA